MDKKQISQASIRWEAHTCLPLHPESSIEPLLLYHQAGVQYISLNIGMDLNPISQIFQSLAHFRSLISQQPQLCLAGSTSEIRRASAQGLLSVGFDLEGALPLMERPEMVDLYASLGVKQMHLAYNRNNSVAGGCHDSEQGLTALGYQVLDAMNHAGVLVDCSHMSERSSLDLIEASKSPAIFSHANPHHLVPHQRNVQNHQLRALSQQGGVVCLNGVNLFLGETQPTLTNFLDHICYVADLIGPKHIGIGLDISFYQEGIDDDPPHFNPSYWWPKEAGYSDGINQVEYLPVSTWDHLNETLLKRGFTESEVEGILGENMMRVLSKVEWVKENKC